MGCERSRDQPPSETSSTRAASSLPSVVVADRELRMEGMALAGDHHVQVPVELHPDRLSRLVSGERDERGKRVALHFLAAECAAHARGLDHDLVARQAKKLRHDGLDF